MKSKRDMHGVRVLVVDDDLACRDAVKAVLEKAGATVDSLPDAESAVDHMATHPCDVVLLDIMLPKMDGMSMLRHIRASKPELPVILMTGFGSVDTAVDALKLGAQDYLLKPLQDHDKLLDSIGTCVERYRLITKNHSLQDQLRESEATFRALFNNANDAIFLHDLSGKGEPGVFTEVNAVACRELGYTKDELSTMTLLNIASEQSKVELNRAMRDLLTWDSIVFEAAFVTKRGKHFPVEISSHLFTLKGRNAVLSLSRNISDRREMEIKIAEASERERRSLGRELHDSLCQDLASVEMLASVLKSSLPPGATESAADADMIGNLAKRSITLARRLAAGLYPVELEKDGLVTALAQLVEDEEHIFHVPCSLSGDRNAKVPNRTASLHLYRIAQEAIRNAVRHSGAKQVSVSLNSRDGGWDLVIEDDGKGLPKDFAMSGGMGAHIMRYRAKVVGAVLKIADRENGKGARVSCFWR